MSDRPFALGFVGCGRLAEAGYLPALAATPGIRLVAVADPDRQRRERVAAAAAQIAVTGGTAPPHPDGRPTEAPGGADVLTFPDAAALLDGVAVDGVVLATPAAAHLADATLAAEAGVATLVEKPPAPDAAGAVALAALDPPPWVGFNRRFDAGAAAVRATLHAALAAWTGAAPLPTGTAGTRAGGLAPATADGGDREAMARAPELSRQGCAGAERHCLTTGRTPVIASTRSTPTSGPGDDGPLTLRLSIAYRRTGWGAHTVRDDALADLGPHLVDWARWITGADVREVAGAEVSTQRAALDLLLDTPGGPGAAGAPPILAELRAAHDRPHAELVELRDARGRVLARHRLGGLVAAVRGRLGGAGPTAMVTTLAAQLNAFATAARGGHVPTLGTAADGHATMAVIDAARAGAAHAGRRTPVSVPGARPAAGGLRDSVDRSGCSATVPEHRTSGRPADTAPRTSPSRPGDEGAR